MTDEPGTAELMRGLDALRQEVQGLSVRLEASYVRRDVQDAREIGTSFQLKGIEDEQHATNKRIDRIEERQAAHFRLLLANLLYPLIVGVVVYLIVGAVVNS